MVELRELSVPFLHANQSMDSSHLLAFGVPAELGEEEVGLMLDTNRTTTMAELAVTSPRPVTKRTAMPRSAILAVSEAFLLHQMVAVLVAVEAASS